MITHSVDVAIVGSGFAGSLLALVLGRLGRSSVLIDRAAHPRFAIGESSTPNADLMLLLLAERYDLPALAPLARYGTWQERYPQVVCGLKRGFSYFHHVPQQPFAPRPDHAGELLVAASADDRSSDTHWLRSDVDALLAGLAIAAGTPLLDRTDIALAAGPLGWRLSGTRDEQDVQVDAKFLVDGTGEYGLVPRTLGIRSELARLKTNSRAIFAHFADLTPWREILAARGGRPDEHPFDCDHAAVHQVIDEGWMYQLRFNSGVTSAGFVLAADEHPPDPARPIEQEWNGLLARYPDLAEQFRSARVVAPAGGLVRTGRLQRRQGQIAGPNWALLPHTAGFIDPLHSTGIAQSLCGIQRLAQALEHHWQSPSLEPALRRYEASLWRELDLIDQLVSACHLSRRTPRLFAACTMLYFAAAHTSETRRLAGKLPPGEGFLCADDPQFRSLVQRTWQQVQGLSRQSAVDGTALDAFEKELASGLRPYNTAGLLDPAAHNLYRFTHIDKQRLVQ